MISVVRRGGGGGVAVRRKLQESVRMMSGALDPYDVVGFKELLSRKADRVNKALEEVISLGTARGEICESQRYSLFAGGKRVRPVLCLMACELVGGSEAVAMPAACALEMVHTCSLIKDDLPCMDNDDLRRGKPSNRKQFHEAVTHLSTDDLSSLAEEHTIRASSALGVPDRTILRALLEMHGTIRKMVQGQYTDVFSSKLSQGLDGNARLELLQSIHVQKTGALFEWAVVAGAILGGGSEEQIEKLRVFARCSGLMFQVVDDILDVTGSSMELGKTPGKDLATHKLTYPGVMGLERSKEVVEELRRQAHEHLQGFDPVRAAPLSALVDFFSRRQQ